MLLFSSVCVSKIAALLKTLVKRWLVRFANVLQCGLGSLLLLREGEKNKINSLTFALSCQKAKSFLVSIVLLLYLSVFLSFYTCCQRLVHVVGADSGERSCPNDTELRNENPQLAYHRTPPCSMYCVRCWHLIISFRIFF